MNFSEKQFDFIKYLLDKLNFDFTIEDNFTIKYIEYISKTYLSFKNIGNCEKTEIFYKNKKENIPKDGIPNIKYLDNGSFYEIKDFSLINFLQLEIEIKSKKKYLVKDTINLDYITATDISNYTYCPVNYSISKTLYYKSLETAVIGVNKHEESLINVITKRNQTHSNNKKNVEEFDDFAFDNIENDDNFKLLKNILYDFDIIYSGHSLNSKNKIFNGFHPSAFGCTPLSWRLMPLKKIKIEINLLKSSKFT